MRLFFFTFALFLTLSNAQGMDDVHQHCPATDDKRENKTTTERYTPLIPIVLEYTALITPVISEGTPEDLQSREKLSPALKGETIKSSFENRATEAKDKIGQLNHGEISGDDALLFFLKSRFEILEEQYQSALKWKETNAFPIDDLCWKHVKEEMGDKSSTESEFNESVRQKRILEYQFFNQIITTLFKALKLEKLSKETIRHLRASPKLWPLLQDQTTNLGHPDEAGGWAIIRAYLEDEIAYPERIFKGDTQVFIIIKNGVPTALSKDGVPDTPLNRAILKVQGVLRPRYKPRWLELQQSVDLAIYQGHFQYVSQQLTLLGLGVKNYLPKNKEAHCVTVQCTKYNTDIWKHPLPNPKFLQLVKKQTDLR